jgi:hypothetical protein
VILDAIARGEIPPPSLLAGETMVQALRRATKGEWRFPAKLSIDVGRESAANMAENRQGAKSLQEIAAEEGTDAFSRLEQIAIEAGFIKELAAKYGVPETAIRLTTNSLPSTPAAAAAAGDAVGASAAEAQRASQSQEPTPAEPVTQIQNESNLVTIDFATNTYIPTVAIADNAKRALEIRDQKPISQRGMTSVGLARARDLMNRRNLSEDTVRRMKAYFDRHESDKKGETWDQQGKGWQAWMGWGGDEGRSWANAIVERLNSKSEPSQMKLSSSLINEILFGKKELAVADQCPVETQDIKANLANRQKAVDVAHYGPANPQQPNTDYWTAKAAQFKTTIAEAKTMRCGNCAAFNVSPRIKDCINKGIGADATEVEQAGELGYCEFFDFKCAGKRTCDAWVVGGPIKSETK